MEKVWLKSYPPGVPAEIDLNEYGSLKDILETSCARFAKRPAYTNFGHTLSYSDVDRLSAAFGAFLQHQLGVSKGDRVAIMMPNLLQYPIALFGILRSGLTAVNVNPLYTPRELEHQLNDSGATVIVILENFVHTLEQVIDRTSIKSVVVSRIGDLLPFPKSALINLVTRHVKKLVPAWKLNEFTPLPKALARGARLDLSPVELDHEDIAFLQYTGGTTGVAKGAVLTHGNMVANLLQASAWLSVSIEEGRERVITALPLYHIFSLTANCLTFMKYGGENLLITNPRDMPGFVKELNRSNFTVITGVNTLFNGLLNTPGFDTLDFSALKFSLGGGMAVQQAVAERWKKVTGNPLAEAYGLTETSPAVCINPLDLEDYNGSIGLPVPSTEISFRDEEDKPLPLGEVGELCVRGPQVMRGYWNRPEETAKVINSEGWLRTGDMGYMREDGYCFIVDRKKDMILVSGFNVYPNEVEDVAARHPGVLEVAAIGVADDKSGEAVILVVVRKDPELTQAQLIEHCRRELTGYKVPRRVEFRDELPKTNVGKILRRALREEHA